MKRRYLLATAIVCLMISVAGCGTVPQGDGVSAYFIGSMNSSSGDFRMDGTLNTGGGVADRDVFRNVSIQLYANDGTVICGATIGDVPADHAHRNISISSQTVPTYVIITSPEFWDEEVEVDYYRWGSSENDYELNYADTREDLPVSIDDSNVRACSG